MARWSQPRAPPVVAKAPHMIPHTVRAVLGLAGKLTPRWPTTKDERKIPGTGGKSFIKSS